MDQQELLSPVTSTNMLGRYRIMRRLGRGGMGEVWLCEDQRLNRQVAVKTLPVQNQQNDTFIQRFEREAKAAAALNHPHILPVHDYGKQPLADDRIITYIVMPYIQGGSLSERIAFYTRQHRLMPPQEALSFLSQAANAIDYAHKQRIIHRDIKPDNMLLRDENWLLLADFGIARMLTGAESLTTAGNGVGTPEFMAPEQARGQADITSDNYSLAVVAYLLFTGRLPFQGESAIATTIQHMIEEPPPPRQFNPSLSPAIEQLLLRGLVKDPAERPALASDFVTQLDRAFQDTAYQPTALPTIRDLPALAFQDSLPALRSESSEDGSSPRRLSRRQMLTVSGIAATALFGGAAGAWGLINSPAHARLQLPAHTPISALPRSIGKDKPVLVLNGHSQAVNSMTWSKDARFLVSSGDDNQVLLWDIPNLLKQPERTSPASLYSNRLGYSLGMSVHLFADYTPDATKLAVANTLSSDRAAQVMLCTSDLKSIAPLPPFFPVQEKDESGIQGIAWIDTRHLAIFATNKLYLVDTTKSQYWTIATSTSNYPSILSSSILSSTRNGFLAIMYDWSVATGQISIASQPTWHPHTTIDFSPYSKTTTLDRIDWSAKGTYLVALLERDIAYLLWQENKPRLHYLRRPDPSSDDGGVLCIACNPASLSPGVAAGIERGEVYLWDFKENSSFVRKLDTGGITGKVKSLAWSPDGHWLAAGYDGSSTSILIWKL